ncbi:hypothetical protein KUTeg_007621 [Tegillarca granosa]|uniref:Major facilitator superfamily (MFS) profile domain-containing protein n=1 Tax=Tegillarca granosa TaxID=220873 RepID=A0ABQ9FDU7_TEGGR|nr:hypothetical protein KUTeg_007621 [Tegillarca granosa]
MTDSNIQSTNVTSYDIGENGTTVEAEKCHFTIKYGNKSEEKPCHSWKYDTSVFTSTILKPTQILISLNKKFNMVCDKVYLQSHAKMAFFGGCLAAAFFDGTIADIIGRRPVYVISFILLFASSLVVTWVPNVTVFVILRFLIGATNFGVFNMGLIIGLEFVGPSKRIWSGIIIELVFCIGELLLCGAAYFIRDWRTLQLVLSVPSAVSLIYFLIIPESPRWLLSQGRYKDAMKTIRKISESNKSVLPDKILDSSDDKTYSFKKTLVEIFKTRSLALRFIIVSAGWYTLYFLTLLVVSMSYYGITYNVGRIGGSVYLNFFLSVIVEFLGYLSCIFLCEKLGRKLVHCGGLLIGGLACIATIFTTLYANHYMVSFYDIFSIVLTALYWITIALSMVGKFFMSAVFANVFLYTLELFPTGIRGFTLSIGNIGARLGGMISPYITELVRFLSLSIPETLNMKLPKNTSEAITFQKFYKDNSESNKNSLLLCPDEEDKNIQLKTYEKYTFT